MLIGSLSNVGSSLEAMNSEAKKSALISKTAIFTSASAVSISLIQVAPGAIRVSAHSSISPLLWRGRMDEQSVKPARILVTGADKK